LTASAEDRFGALICINGSPGVMCDQTRMQAHGKDDPGRAVRWVRIGYWCGAITDLLAVVAMVFPGIGAALYGLEDFRPGSDYSYAIDTAAALMLGWTALLIWADRRPLERKGVLVLTVCPVITGLVLGEIIAVRSGFLPLVNVIPTLVVQVALSVLLLYGYALAVASTQHGNARGRAI
jgi:hypothetical protein